MAFATLITPEYIKIRNLVDQNVDDRLLETYIVAAQDTQLQFMLGETLYQKIMNDVYNTGTSTGYYLTLLANYIQPSMMWHTLDLSIDDFQVKHTNKSLLVQTSINSTPASDVSIEKLRSKYRSLASFYDQRINEQIINNPANYPEYYQFFGIDRIKPLKTSYTSGTYTRRYPRNRLGGGNGPDDCIGGSQYESINP